MTKVKNRDRAKPKSALNLSEHRAGLSPSPAMTESAEHMNEHKNEHEPEQMRMPEDPKAAAHKKEKRFGHN